MIPMIFSLHTSNSVELLHNLQHCSLALMYTIHIHMHSHAITYPHTHITHLLYSCKWYFQVELLCCSFLHCLLLEEDQKVLHLFETGGSEATSVVKEKSESGVAEALWTGSPHQSSTFSLAYPEQPCSSSIKCRHRSLQVGPQVVTDFASSLVRSYVGDPKVDTIQGHSGTPF